MRYDNYIETIHQMSSRRATATTRLHRGVNSSGNTSRYDRHLKDGLMAGQQPLGVSQTLKVSSTTLPRPRNLGAFAWVYTATAQWYCVAEENTSRFQKHLKVSATTTNQSLGVSQTLKVSSTTLPRESFAWVSVNPELTNHTMQSCGSDFLSNLNTSRFQKHLKVSATTTNQSLGVSQTLKVSRSEKTEFANCRLNLPIDAFKLPIDGLNGRLLLLDCQLSHLNCQLSAQTTRGAVNMGVLEKLTDAGEFALPPVSASLRTTELAAAWSICNNHAIQSRGSDALELSETEGYKQVAGSAVVVKPSRFTKHLKVSPVTAFQPLGVFKTLKVSETEHSSVISTKDEERSIAVELQPTCHLEGGRTERSVATELCSNRFPAYRQAGSSSFGMTDKLATCNLHLATELLTIKYNNPQSKYWDDRVVNSNFIPDPSPCRELPLQGKPVLNRAGAHPTCSFVGSKLFPLKKGKPCLPAGRWLQPKGSGAALIEKKAHLSKTKTMGTRDNKLFPFFLISNLATALPKFRDYCVSNRINKPHDAIVRQQRDSHWNANVLPLLRGGARRAEGDIVANTNKSSAYET
ncbi:hypothetical protein [Draconibacterium orientale]|uniref:hypothetical protein n=1 Tax=Draconibacterium orientale TaxID=1168034 RepID=UPI002ABD83AF|nr:hypothetical protein [Draconibacterium orientale]